jgi:hypothetical protein
MAVPAADECQLPVLGLDHNLGGRRSRDHRRVVRVEGGHSADQE